MSYFSTRRVAQFVLHGALFFCAAWANKAFSQLHPSNKRGVSLKFISDERPLPLVDVTIDGSEPLPFLLDTGACRTILSPQVVKRLGLTISSKGTGQTAGGKSYEVSYVKLGALQLGDKTIADCVAAVAEMPDKAPFDGILGIDVLRRFTITIDSPNKTLLLE